MYDYAKRLQMKFGNDNISCFSHDHVFFLDDPKIFIQGLRIFNSTSDTKLSYMSSSINKKVNHDIGSDLNYLKSLKQMIPLIELLDKTYNYVNKTQFIMKNPKWFNFLASKMNMRDGKSIFVTEFTQTIVQHFCNSHFHSESIEKTRFMVPLETGFVSHFRDEAYDFLRNQNYPLSFLLFDIEHYLYILSLFNNFTNN